jgi:[CysO sulfur-carrier protein]-S-L-cysteine hydrolase
MKTLWLTEQQVEQILQHAIRESPREACGLIAGRDYCAKDIVPVPNIAADPTQYYEMEHRALVRAMFEIERRDLTLIAIYHSHPDGDTIPSRTDIRQAYYRNVVYVIVSLSGSAPRLAGWLIQPHQVDVVHIHVGSRPPPEGPSELSNSHKFAIVIGAILAFVFMIVVSLSLLPPAPEIP